MKKSFLPKNWWWKPALLTSITTSVIVYTYKNEIFGRQSHPPSLNPVVHYDQTNTIPILNYLTEAKKQKVPLHFSIPNYDNDPAEIFRYLATRVISIAVVSTKISSTLDLFDFNNSFTVNFGTATILGPANDLTKNGQDYQYYLASNVHVLENFIHPSNKRIIGTYFGFNHFFLDQLKNNFAPKVADLENKENKLKVNFSQNKVISQYFPFQVQNDFHYLAKDIQVKNLQFAHTRNYWANFPTSIQSFSPNIKKQFAADFGVIKVNLQPTTPLPLFSQLLSWSFDSYQLPKIAINSDLNKRNEYLSQLKNNISKYGGLKFSKNSVNTGYMMSYPGVNTPQDNSSGKDLISINLKLDYLANRLVKQKISLLSNNKNYKFPFQTPSSPTVDYVVPALNLLPGSSGSPLITYDPNQNDFNKFQMNGIYWGITYWSDQKSHPNNDHQVSKINGSNGMITKLIVDNDYDLIGIGNQPTNNSLCAKIKSNNSYSPDFCSSALVLGK